MVAIVSEWHNKAHPRQPNSFRDDERLTLLCNELRSLARVSPGIDPSSTSRVRAIAQEIQGSVDSKGTDIRGDAIEIMDGFQLWFSQRKWNQSGDKGQHVSLNIFASILKLEGGVRQIHRTRTKPTQARYT